jgi:predicted nucleotidyltransferase
MTTQVLDKKRELEKELLRITDVLIRDYAPEKIILFGSLASGGAGEDSDIDLVIVKETGERFLERLHRVRLLTHPNVGVDFLVYTEGEVRAMKQEGRRFMTKEIMEKGKVLYEKK